MRATTACGLLFLILSAAFLYHEVVLAPGGPDAPAVTDLLAVFYPQLRYAFAELRAGHLPLWNPHLACGTALLGHPQIGFLYPLYAPFLVLAADDAVTVHILLHLALAGLFTWLFCRAAGMSSG